MYYRRVGDVPAKRHLRTPGPGGGLLHEELMGELDDTDFVGEDIYFCKKVNEAGFGVWCDPTIDVGHLGLYRY